MNVLSLFDGISCGQLALNRANKKVHSYYSSEVDEYAIKVTQKHFPYTVQLGDINNFEQWKLPKIDIIIGGSPCQDLSSIKQHRTGLNGEKSKLFYLFIECVKKFKPKYFLLENNSTMQKKFKDEISEILGVQPIEINSSLVSGQSRKRLYWTNIPNVCLPSDKNIMFADVLDDCAFKEIPNFFFNKWGDKKRIDKGVNVVTNEKSRCLTTNHGHPPQYLFNADKSMCRLLNIHECERLQTLPEDYTKVEGVSITQRHKQVGNAWTVDVIAHIFSFLEDM